MTALLFSSLGYILMGYIFGKLYIRLNPFLMLIGLFPLFTIWVVIAGTEYQSWYLSCVALGAILNFERPISYIRGFISDLFSTFKLKKIHTAYVDDIQNQKQQAEQDLYEQKRQVEEELLRKAEQIKRSEEELKRQAENLRRDQENYSRNQQNNQSNSSSSSQSGGNKRHLNPLVFADACEILEMSQGKTRKEYKAAYLKLMKLYHADKLAGLPEELRLQEEKKAKLINLAWDTIKKKLKK